MNTYSLIETGTANSFDYRGYFVGPHGPISCFHDIHLFANTDMSVMNMVVEIPRWTNAKMEICKEEPLNPIKQDVKNGKLRFVDSVFPFRGYIWNYGALPQTWEDPSHVDADSNTHGDNDPLDVCEIGSKIHPRGSIIQVKALGVLGLIDEGETDWKVIVIDVNDPQASKMNDIADVEKVMPGYLNASRHWFRVYKMPQGKPQNAFAYNGEFQDRNFAMGIIQHTHKYWHRLLAKQTDNGGIVCDNVTVAGSPYMIDRQRAENMVRAAGPLKPATSGVDPATDVWHFVNL